ncbi:MAG: cupin domain-containing protein [Bacteroidota bacterium]
MNFFNDFADLKSIEYIQGFHGQMLHLNGFTFAKWRIEAGSILPEHLHEHEQLSYVLEGEFEMTIDGETQICKSGGVVSIPGHAKHSGKALTDCVLIDVFQPVREDYKSRLYSDSYRE